MAKKNKEVSKAEEVLKKNQDNTCPRKEGDNCLEPGVFNDSDPIGGGG